MVSLVAVLLLISVVHIVSAYQFSQRSRIDVREEPHVDPSDQPSAQLDRLHNTRMSRRGLFFSALAAPISAKASTGQKDEKQKTLEESISGFVAGASLTVTKTVVKYPLDTATVRLQMKNSDYSIFDLPRLFKGSYQGILTPLLANIPAGAVFFAVKDASKQALKDSIPNKWARTLASVALAQIPYWLVRNPSEVVKTRQQAGIDGYAEGVSSWDAYKKVAQDAKEDPNSTVFSAYYSGYWENIIYAFPADAIKFVCYDQLSKGRKDLSPLESAVAGAISTAVAQYVTTPLDVLRNRIMASSGNDTDREGYAEAFRKLAREEGYSGLFAGASPRVGKALLSGAIQFATYEETKKEIMKKFSGG